MRRPRPPQARGRDTGLFAQANFLMKKPRVLESPPATSRRLRRAWDISVHADEIYPPQAGLEPALALLQRTGIKHTTLRVVNGRDSIVRLDDAEVRALGRMLKKYGLKAAAIETPVFKGPLLSNRAIDWGNCPGFSSDMSLHDHFWYLARAFEIADQLGATQVRCFAFWREYPLQGALRKIVDHLGRAAELARTAGRILYVQNQADTLAGTGAELARIVHAVNSPHLRAVYDVGNAARLAADVMKDDYPELRGVLGAIQVKFQVIDIRSGTGHPSPDLADHDFPFPPYFIWQQESLPISGWVELDGRRFELTGERTFVPIEDTIGIPYASLFQQLQQDGYEGLISVDSAYHLPESAITEKEIETGFAKTIASLRSLIGKTWA